MTDVYSENILIYNWFLTLYVNMYRSLTGVSVNTDNGHHCSVPNASRIMVMIMMVVAHPVLEICELCNITCSNSFSCCNVHNL